MTNFEQWLDTVFKSEAAPKEILDLYKVVESPAKGAIGNFGITKDQNEGWVVSCKSVAEKLSIAHERDRIVFLSLIHTKYVNDTIDVETWALQQA
ncbi:hypothetical protein C942_02356 [Photobacterium marinum]|uniref:Uncharacterized protein n=1 Tax=Photobacterium marinum TaxID=1056511 RepID=L8J8L3_9GAMM|nr:MULTISPECIES: hypothetical protein [Photobacterium]ELR64543.1 hypothetical protein C942_02356 [Photobacterium marinum]